MTTIFISTVPDNFVAKTVCISKNVELDSLLTGVFSCLFINFATSLQVHFTTDNIEVISNCISVDDILKAVLHENFEYCTAKF